MLMLKISQEFSTSRSWSRVAVLIVAALLLGTSGGRLAAAADRYWDTSNTTGLQGGSGSLNGSNWSTNVSGTAARTTIGSSNDVFFQATDAPLSYTGTFTNGTNLTIGNWTVANGNAVTTIRNSSGGGGTTFTISGTILVTGSSSMNWGLASWSLAGTPALTISQSSTNTILGNAGAGDKTLDFSALTFGTGSNALRLTEDGSTNAVAVSFTSLSGAAGNSIFLQRSNYSLTLNNTAASSFSGVISGSGSVTKQGVGSLTLGGSNTYSGPTTISGGSVVFAAAHVLPNTSAVTLANATLTTGSFADTVASFTSGTGTINMTIAGSTVGSLSTTGALALNGSNTLALTLDNPTLGRYSLFNYTGSRTGTFSTVSGAPNWNVIYGSASNSTIDLQQKANQAWAVTPANTRALVDTNVALTGLLTNSSGSGAASLTVSASSTGLLSISGLPTGTVVGGSSATVNATIAAGATLGSRTWSIVNTDANAITTSATATGTLTVVQDRTYSPTAIAFGRFLSTSAPTGTSTITSTGLSGTTASGTIGAFATSSGLSLSLAGGTNGFSGTSALQSATYTTSSLYSGALGAVSGTFAGTATNEFSGTSVVAIAYTGTAVAQRSFTTTSGTILLGNFLRTTSVTGSTMISSTGLYATTASATLDGFTGTNTAGFGLALASGSNAFDGGSAVQEAVYALTGSATAAGVIAGNFSSNMTPEFGTIAARTVALTGTAYDAATASFASGSTTTSLLVDIGTFDRDTGSHSAEFEIFNLLADPTFTADLALTSITDVGTPSESLSINLTSGAFGDLGAGGTSSWLATLLSATTGSFANTYQLNFTSKKGGASLGGSQSLTLTVQGFIAVPEPGTVGLAGIGVAVAAFWCRRRS